MFCEFIKHEGRALIPCPVIINDEELCYDYLQTLYEVETISNNIDFYTGVPDSLLK